MYEQLFFSNLFGNSRHTLVYIFYNLKVKPILEQNCFECHADDPEDLGGSLALTSKASILRGGDSGPAVNATRTGRRD